MSKKHRHRKRINRVCTGCGKIEFICDSGVSTRKFCMDCHRQRTLAAFKATRDLRSANKPMSICKHCEHEYYSRLQPKNSFCSIECRRMYSRIERNCAGCGCLFTIPQSGAHIGEHDVGMFCSRGCYVAFTHNKQSTRPFRLCPPRRFVIPGEPRTRFRLTDKIAGLRPVSERK